VKSVAIIHVFENILLWISGSCRCGNSFQIYRPPTDDKFDPKGRKALMVSRAWQQLSTEI
jgi:hypothetical protein